MSDFGGVVFLLSFALLIGMTVAWQVAYYRVKREIEHFNANRPVDPESGLVDPGKPQMF